MRQRSDAARMTESHRLAPGNLHDTTVGGEVVRSKIWLLLLACAAVLLLAHGGTVTSGYFSDVETSSDNVLRVKNAPLMGAADSFAVLAGTTVTNAGSPELTVVTGDLGVSPGTSVTGFPTGTVIGTIHINDLVAAQAQADLTTAYNDALARTSPFPPVTGDTLGGKTLAPGVYDGGALDLTGALTLDGGGDAEAVWIIRATTTLNTAASSEVILSGGARAANVYWVVGSSATLGASSIFKGTIMAHTSITVGALAEIAGRTLAQNGAVTLDSDLITKPGL